MISIFQSNTTTEKRSKNIALHLENDNIKDYGSRPTLLRSESHSDDSTISSTEDETSCILYPTTSLEEENDSFFDSLSETLSLLIRGMTADFCKNGLPWEGEKCRSMMAGLSGILYVLPVLVATGHPYDQIMWSVQAFLSVMADYFHVHHDSMWHGIDRYFALFNLVTSVLRALDSLTLYMVCLAAIPVGCYVGANRAKQEHDLESWHFFHFMWHLTGAPLLCLLVYLLHACPNVDSTLKFMCK